MSLSSLSRRHFFGGAASIAAAVTAPRTVFAQAPAAAPEPVPSGPFTVPPLTYPTNAFEPHIDARTMEIHHDKHHGAYVAALNSFAKDHPQIAEKPVLEVLGGLEKFQTDFNAAGGRQFGSGWVFVTVTKDGKLKIETRPNQDTPLMDGKRVLFGNDVWEHAYYLTTKTPRIDYLKAWWNT